MEGQKEITPELREAAQKHCHRDFSYDADPFEDILAYTMEYEAFIAGAMWQKEQTKSDNP